MDGESLPSLFGRGPTGRGPNLGDCPQLHATASLSVSLVLFERASVSKSVATTAIYMAFLYQSAEHGYGCSARGIQTG